MSSITSLYALFIYFYVMVRRICTTYWLKFNIWISNTNPGPVTDRRHKVLVIGDSLGLGVGDWTVPGQVPGISPHLLQCIALDPAVRQRWFVLNRAVSGSSSLDWTPPTAPPSPSGQSSSSEKDVHVSEKGKGGKLFERVFGKGRPDADAEIVVIMLGLSDILNNTAGLPLAALGRNDMGAVYPESELATVVKNVRSLATYLRAAGKKVVIVDLPTNGAMLSSFGTGKVKRINRQLRQVWKKDLLKTGEASDGNKVPCAIVPLGSNHKIMRPENRAFDGLHFVKNGYKLMALDVFMVMKPMCISVEFSGWRKDLGDLGEYQEAASKPVDAFVKKSQ